MGNCVCRGEDSNSDHFERNGSDRRHSLNPIVSGSLRGVDYPTNSRLETMNLSNGSGNNLTSGSSSSQPNNLYNNETNMSQKSEKKTFYSRIPPLGRSGSDKKHSNNINTTNLSIKDNNNHAYSDAKISTLFDSYKEENEDMILAEGIERLCKDLDVMPDDFKVLVFAWCCGADEMCRFTREEFRRGMHHLKTDSIKGAQKRLPEISKEVLSDSTHFKELYRFTFKFGLEAETGQRTLDSEMAISLWKVVFSNKEPPILKRWIAFLEYQPHRITRDTWNMLLNFVEIVGTDLSSYDDTEAWPTLFDDFVEFENDQLNQNFITNVEKSDLQHDYEKSQQSHLNNSKT